MWIHNYSLSVKLLYKAQSHRKLWVWGEEQNKTFKEIKRALINAPAVGLPDVMKPFFLYVHERLGQL
jgi:hypothetical protein